MERGAHNPRQTSVFGGTTCQTWMLRPSEHASRSSPFPSVSTVGRRWAALRFRLCTEASGTRLCCGTTTLRRAPGCCLRRTLNTVSIYRHWLRTSGFIFTQANYRRFPREYFDLGRGRFFSSEGRWLVQRLPDLVELNPANIFRVNKGSKNIQGVLNPGFLGYRFSICPVPEQLAPRPPPSGPSRDAKLAVAESRQSRRIIVPRIPEPVFPLRAP